MTAIGVRVLPFAEGTLTNHNPVAKDEVARTPEAIRTYLLASVTAYTLDRIRLNKSVTWMSITISPHRQEYEAEG